MSESKNDPALHSAIQENSDKMTPIGVVAPSLRIVFPALMLVMLLAALDQTIVSTALPTIVGEMGGLDRLSWVVTAYLLASTIVVPIYGKLGDLFGRKIVIQAAIVIFLVGSALCGLAQTMMELVLLRALQGLGGGGLMVVAMAAIGDVIPPAERGKYQGYFGAVFGVSTVIGPLLGGFLVEHFSWRWIFYLNLPLGALALVAIAAAFKPHVAHIRRQIDYWGAGFLALALTGITLFATEGGTSLPWGSVELWMTLAVGLIGLAGFIQEQRSAPEPLLPLHLFRIRTFALACAISFVVGFAMFGAITFVPLYLQVVKGSTPSQAGLQMVPMMGGLLAASILSGRWISKKGKYRAFPIAGTFLAAMGMLLLSRVSLASPLSQMYESLVVLGVGLGLVMQVLVLAAQNAVEIASMGVATSSVTLFRSIGGSIGVAFFGAFFSSSLHERLARLIGGDQALPESLRPSAIQALPTMLKASYLNAFSNSLHGVYLSAAAFVAIAFMLSVFIKNAPLRKRAGPEQEAAEASPLSPPTAGE